ncbi:MAG: hypothetical protein LBL47_03145 [Lactobacillus sp.]|jgi:hypothetical protein|nr:hypothetical protein [Lactobacillus sp.]
MNRIKIFHNLETGKNLLLDTRTGDFREVEEDGDYQFYSNGVNVYPNEIVQIGKSFLYKEKKLFSSLYPKNKYRLKLFHEPKTKETYYPIMGPDGVDNNKFVIGKMVFKFLLGEPAAEHPRYVEFSNDDMIMLHRDMAYSFNKRNQNYYQTSKSNRIFNRGLPGEMVNISHIIDNVSYLFEISRGEFPHFIGHKPYLGSFNDIDLLIFKKKVAEGKYKDAVMQEYDGVWRYISVADTVVYRDKEMTFIDKDSDRREVFVLLPEGIYAKKNK